MCQSLRAVLRTRVLKCQLGHKCTTCTFPIVHSQPPGLTSWIQKPPFRPGLMLKVKYNASHGPPILFVYAIKLYASSAREVGALNSIGVPWEVPALHSYHNSSTSPRSVGLSVSGSHSQTTHRPNHQLRLTHRLGLSCGGLLVGFGVAFVLVTVVLWDVLGSRHMRPNQALEEHS
jgi:hypothetical protein